MSAVRVLRWVWMAGLALAWGCADGGGTGGGGGNGSLQLVQTEPADGASEVDTAVVLRARFDGALSEASVTADSFRVMRDDGAEVQGTLSVTDDTAIFTPTQNLALLRSYTATVTTAIESLSGETLETIRSWSFTIRDGAWGEPVLVEINNAGPAFDPKVTVDSNGRAVAVWAQSDGAHLDIWSNRFTPDQGWADAQLIETNDAGDAYEPEVAVDANGNAIAVWQQFDGARFNIWANRFTSTAGWGVAELIESDDTGDSFDARVAVDPDGNAIAVWVLADANRADIAANRFMPDQGWGTADLIETDDAGDAYDPDVVVDPSGTAIAIWTQSDGVHYNILANRFTLSEGWGVPDLVEAGYDSGYPQVAVDASGNATAVWEHLVGLGKYNIWANRFTPAQGWAIAGLVQIGNEADAHYPRVALDLAGNAFVVWQQWNGTGYDIWATRFTPAQDWDDAELIQRDDMGDSSGAEVAVDPGGNAIAVWHQRDGSRYDIWANRFTPNGGWSIAERLETDDTGNANSATVTVDPNGHAIAVWQQDDGARFNIWASRFE